MLGSDRPSDSQVEGCVEALSVSRCPQGEFLSSGTVFSFARLRPGGMIRITRWFSAFAIVPHNNRLPFLPCLDEPEPWLRKPRGFGGWPPRCLDARFRFMLLCRSRVCFARSSIVEQVGFRMPHSLTRGWSVGVGCGGAVSLGLAKCTQRSVKAPMGGNERGSWDVCGNTRIFGVTRDRREINCRRDTTAGSNANLSRIPVSAACNASETAGRWMLFTSTPASVWSSPGSLSS
jgi:hypothetical protein